MAKLKEYIVEAMLPEPISEEMIQLIPLHRMRVNELMAAGKIVTYTLALDRSKLWISIHVADEAELWGILNQLPLAPYVEFEVTPVAFQMIANQSIYQLSLN